MYKEFFCVVILTAIALAGAAVFAAVPEGITLEEAEPAARDPERVLARVEGHEIIERDIDQLLAAAGPQAVMMYDNEYGRRLVLEELIANRLFALSGKKQGLDDTPEFRQALDAFITNAMARAAVEEAIRDVAVSDEESRSFYDENLDTFTTPDEIRARHILIPDDETSADMVVLIMGELEEGVSFDVLAVEHSIDPTAQHGGGDLGFFTRGQMVSEFEEAAFALQEPGDISEPVRSDFGWHIIKLEEKRPSAVMPYEEVRPHIEQFLFDEKMTQRYQEELETLRQEFTVEILN